MIIAEAGLHIEGHLSERGWTKIFGGSGLPTAFSSPESEWIFLRCLEPIGGQVFVTPAELRKLDSIVKRDLESIGICIPGREGRLWLTGSEYDRLKKAIVQAIKEGKL